MRFSSIRRLDHTIGRLAAATTVALLAFASATPAAIITVTGTGDTIAVDGLLTLREAITAANTNAASGDAAAGDVGLDTIAFNISGAPGTVHTIAPTSALPAIIEAIFIDGYTQLGATESTAPIAGGTNAFLAIDLDGASAGATSGLSISATGGSTVKGLIIRRFAQDGIVITAGSHAISGNFIGTDSTGSLDHGNGGSGIAVKAGSSAGIGGFPEDSNLISGNDVAGIFIDGVTSTGISGNFIGTDDTGTAALANGGDGIRISGASNQIQIVVNVIAFNTGAGIRLDSTVGPQNGFTLNFIHSNGGLGIDLGNDGVTLNDPLDVDSGPNARTNFPVLTSATASNGQFTVVGTFSSTPSTTFFIEFSASTSCDPSGHGEGEKPIGLTEELETDLAGNASFVFTGPGDVVAEQAITATASVIGTGVPTTSEYSACVIATAGDPVIVDDDESDSSSEDPGTADSDEVPTIPSN